MQLVEVFGRGQVLWAVWQLFLKLRYDDPRRATAAPPSEFMGRVKKLWQLGVPIPPDERPGTGTSVEYTSYHAFELAVALLLQDAGVNVGDAADLVKDMRGKLQHTFRQLGADPAYLKFRLNEIREANVLLGAIKQKPRRVYVNLNIVSKAQLDKDLDKLQGHALIVLELSGVASRLREHLANSPKIRRGRP